MTDTFARATAWVALGQSSVKVSQVVIAAALVRMVDAATWNQVALLLTVYVTGVSIGSLNAHHGIAYFLPRLRRDQGRSLVFRTMALVLALGTAGFVGTAIGVYLIGSPGDRAQVLAIVAAVVLDLPATCVGTALIAIRRFAIVAMWDAAGTLGLIAGCVVPAALGGGALGVAWGLVAVGGARLPAALLLVRRLLDGGGRADRAVVVSLVRYGLPLALTIAVAMLNRTVDKWYIAWFDPQHFGVYAVAAQEIPVLSVLPYAGGAALMSALVDAFRRKDLALARSHWVHLTMRMSSFVVPIGVAVAMIGPDLLTLAFTADFAPAGLSFQIFAVITVHRVAEYGLLLRAAGRTRAVVQVALLTLASNVVLAGVGAALGGMTGASLGTAGATAIGWAVAMRHIAGALDIRVRDAFAWLAWVAQLSIAMLAALVAELVAGELDGRFTLGPAGRAMTELLVFAVTTCVGVRLWRAHPRSVGPALRFTRDPSPSAVVEAVG